MSLRGVLRVGLVTAVLAATYVFGAISYSHDIWPMGSLRDVKRVAADQPVVLNHKDAFGRLIARRDKTLIPCPAQTPETAVVLFLGQSIQSNSAGQKAVSTHGDRVISWFGGHCAVAQSPLEGASEIGGEALTPIGNKLVAMEAFQRVMLVPVAIGQTLVSDWAPRGRLHKMLLDSLSQLSPQYRITHVVWHQGEEDFDKETSQADYANSFRALTGALRAHGVDAPIYVSVTSRCDADYRWTADNDVTRAQRSVIDASRNIRAGVDTDALLQPLDRFDDCHLGGSGVEKYSTAVAQLLRPAKRTEPGAN